MDTVRDDLHTHFIDDIGALDHTGVTKGIPPGNA